MRLIFCRLAYEAMREAIHNLGIMPEILLNDAVMIPDIAIAQVPIIKGDAKSISIAAASIFSKGDEGSPLMLQYDKIMPEYGFAKHKGYGSQETYCCIERIWTNTNS